MVESSWWRTSSSGTLVPCHRHRVEGIQVFKWLILLSFSSKNDNSWTSEKSSMAKSWSWWRSLYLWLYPSARIQVKHVCVVEVNITLFLPTIIVAAEVQNRRANQSGRMSTSRTWWNSFNLWKSPKPWSILTYKCWKNVTVFGWK